MALNTQAVELGKRLQMSATITWIVVDVGVFAGGTGVTVVAEGGVEALVAPGWFDGLEADAGVGVLVGVTRAATLAGLLPFPPSTPVPINIPPMITTPITIP